MSTTVKQDTDFGRAMLDPIVAWVSEEMEPQGVFVEQALKDWARDQEPQAIFDEPILSAWAVENGYTKGES